MTTVIESSALAETAFADADAAAQAWALTASAVGGCGIARQESRRGRKVVYTPRDSRPITATLPKRSCAVMLYDATQRIHCLAFDLDAKHVPSDRVRADSVALAALLRSCGFVVWIDESPSGGRHVYALLATPVSFLELRPYLAGLRKRFPTLDIAPLANRTAGCIRPSGSPHPRGGYQQLVTSIEQVRADLATGSHRDAWLRLKLVIPAEEQPVPQAALDLTDSPVVDIRGRRLPTWAESLATSGDLTGRYPTDSHARMAVAGAAAYAGWTESDYLRAIKSRWEWLRASYTAKGRTLAKAAGHDLEKAHSNAPGKMSARQGDTSHERRTRRGVTRQPESTNKQIRRWISHTTTRGRTHPHQSYSPAKQALVRAIGVLAILQDRSWINAGVRAYAAAAGISHKTAAKLLHELADDGVMWRAKEGHGTDADMWVLNLDQARTATPWRGKVHGTRAVFRVLGGWQVAEVYEELVRRRGAPVRSGEVATAIGRAKSTVDEALGALAAYKLADGTAGWVVGAADPQAVAVQLGADELEANQIATYKAQRAKWRAYLAGLPRIRKQEATAQREAAQEVMWAAEWELVEPPEPPWLDVVDVQPNRRRLRDLA